MSAWDGGTASEEEASDPEELLSVLPTRRVKRKTAEPVVAYEHLAKRGWQPFVVCYELCK